MLSFFLSLGSYQTASAKKIAVYFGGADGDPAQRENIFKGPFLNYAENLTKRQWDTSFYYSGADKNSKNVRNKVAGAQEFSKENYNKKIRQLIKDIESGKISKNDSLLVVLDTHGDVINGKYKFSIEDTKSGSEAINLLQKTASKNNIKLGIIDGTCYSGNLLKLADKNTCVITAATDDRVGRISFNHVISEKLGNLDNRNLETLFLDSRISELTIWGGLDNLPQISTQAGTSTYQAIKDLKNSLIMTDNAALSELRKIDYECQKIDPLKRQIQNLSKNLNELNVSAELKKKTSFKNLYRNLEEYENIRRKYITASMNSALLSKKCLEINKDEIKKLQDLNLSKNINMSSCYQDPDKVEQTEEYLKKILLEASMPGAVAASELLPKNKNDKNSKSSNINLVDLDNKKELENSKQGVNILLNFIKEEKKTKRFSDARKAKDVVNNIDYQKMNNLVREIGANERYLYNEFYKKYSENDKKPNACRDFSL